MTGPVLRSNSFLELITSVFRWANLSTKQAGSLFLFELHSLTAFYSKLKSLKHMSMCLNTIVHLGPFLLSKSFMAVLKVNQYVTGLSPFAAADDKFVLPKSPSTTEADSLKKKCSDSEEGVGMCHHSLFLRPTETIVIIFLLLILSFSLTFFG